MSSVTPKIVGQNFLFCMSKVVSSFLKPICVQGLWITEVQGRGDKESYPDSLKCSKINYLYISVSVYTLNFIVLIWVIINKIVVINLQIKICECSVAASEVTLPSTAGWSIWLWIKQCHLMFLFFTIFFHSFFFVPPPISRFYSGYHLCPLWINSGSPTPFHCTSVPLGFSTLSSTEQQWTLAFSFLSFCTWGSQGNV